MDMKVANNGFPKMTRTRTVEKCGNQKRTRIELKYADGTLAGSISITEPIKKKTKKLQYNFKEISTRIMQTKTSGDASRILASARAKVAMLARKLKSGEYDEKEVQSALIHAEAMARVARKRMKHLREEENSKRQGGTCEAELEEKQDGEALAELAAEGEAEGGKNGREELQKLKREYQKLKREYQKMMRDTQKELEESIRDTDGMDELSEELAVAAADNLDPADLELMKKKHRAKEMREIMEADMKYLKALFDQLAKEKQEIASGGAGGMGNGSSAGTPVDSGVALELGGADVPVAMSAADVAAVAEGGAIDVTV